MKPINELAVELLKDKKGINTQPNDWGYESLQMVKEEIDSVFIPQDKELPELVMADTAIYEQYLVYRLWHLETKEVYVEQLREEEN